MARAAYSLDVLLGQLNALYPNRDKDSDGWIGDEAHQSRVSDHNPDRYGIVRARDYTNDPVGGIPCQWLADVLVRQRDPRVKYIIWDRRIWQPDTGWKPYSGSNPHTKHLHLSVVADSRADDTRKWTLHTTAPEVPDMTKDESALLKTIGDKVDHLWSRYRQGETGVQTPGIYAVYLAGVKNGVDSLKEENKVLREEIGALTSTVERLVTIVEGLQ